METLRVKWDLFIIILAIYNSICIPISISFKPPSFDSWSVNSFNNFIDICFWLDIAITFRTTYKHPITGGEISDIKKISKNYISGQFWIDLVSTFPFEFIGELFEITY